MYLYREGNNLDSFKGIYGVFILCCNWSQFRRVGRLSASAPLSVTLLWYTRPAMWMSRGNIDNIACIRQAELLGIISSLPSSLSIFSTCSLVYIIHSSSLYLVHSSQQSRWASFKFFLNYIISRPDNHCFQCVPWDFTASAFRFGDRMRELAMSGSCILSWTPSTNRIVITIPCLLRT